MAEVEKNALFDEKGKTGIINTFAKKEKLKQHFHRIEYQWTLTGFPIDTINLIKDFIETGTIYILRDEKLRISLHSFVSPIIRILEEYENRDDYIKKIKALSSPLQETLIQYDSQFSKTYKSSIVIFFILINDILHSILRNEVQHKSEESIRKTEAEITRVIKSIYGFVKNKNISSMSDKVSNFIDRFIFKIPILAKPVAEMGLNELDSIFISKGLSKALFNSLYKILLDKLMQTMGKNFLQTFPSQNINSKEELLKNIDIPITKKIANEIINSVKQSVSKQLSNLEEIKLKIEKDIKKDFEGFEQTSTILWEAINSEIKNIKEGKDGNTLEEIIDRSDVISSFIKKKMWSIMEIMKRKKKLDTTISNLRKLEALTAEQLVKYSSKIKSVPKIEELANFYFALIKHFGVNKTVFPASIIEATEKIIKDTEKEEAKNIINTFSEKHLLGKKYFPNKLLSRFVKCFEDGIIPLYIQYSLMKFFSIWPPIAISEKSKALPDLEKELLYVGDFLIPEGKYLRMGEFPSLNQKGAKKQDVTLTNKIVKKFSNVVAVLVYDIRGSTFMGTKLGSAERESFIRKKFSERMLSVAEKYSAFPVKDTGDGGILFFSANSSELFGNIYRQDKLAKEWIRLKTDKKETMIKEGTESAKMAIVTAKQMIYEAQKFVSQNINEYSDWFKEDIERKLFFKGMNYAQLPPSYRRIFQIGIGIASGHTGKDIHFSINAYGDPDITGNLIRDANLYSKARNPETSVILIDSSTLLNLLLNEQTIEPIVVEKKVGGLSETEIYKYLLDKTFLLANRTENVTYKLKNHGLTIERIGYRIMEKGKDERIIPTLTISELGLTINDTGQIKDKKGGIIKFLYEVSLEE